MTNFLWILAVGGWVCFLLAFIGFLGMAEFNRQSLQLAQDILDDWRDAIVEGVATAAKRRKRVGKDGNQ